MHREHYKDNIHCKGMNQEKLQGKQRKAQGFAGKRESLKVQKQDVHADREMTSAKSFSGRAKWKLKKEWALFPR